MGASAVGATGECFERQRRVSSQGGGVLVCQGAQGSAIFGRQGEKAVAARRAIGGQIQLRRFGDNDMGIGAAKAKGANPRKAWRHSHRPGLILLGNGKRRSAEINMMVALG